MADAVAIILAAGKSTRMNSARAKVLHEVCGQPMLAYTIDACRSAGVGRILLVVGHDRQAVRDAFSDQPDIEWVEQLEQKGTGHAVQVCAERLGDFSGQTVVLAGDMPLIRAETVRAMLDEQRKTGDAVTLATTVLDDPGAYGRIDRDEAGRLRGIVEFVDCNEQQRAIGEVNVSYYCFDNARMFEMLGELKADNAKGEYYLTDLVGIAFAKGHGAGAIAAVAPNDAMGVNTRGDLALINRMMQERIQDAWMAAGVTIVSPERTWIESGCSIGVESVIHPFTHIACGASIGQGCRVGPYATVAGDDSIPDGGSVGCVQFSGATCS